MQGIVTVDDIVDVVREEATEDIQKIGGTVALAAPYLHVGLLSMVGKRLPWLSVLFVGQFLTTAAMSYFEGELARALVLAVFIPLIISSGGNSGAQASTLVIRAMGMGEVRLRDWWRVLQRELGVGLLLGLVLGAIGLLRVLLWPTGSAETQKHETLLAVTVASSLVGIVLWGSLVGAMLPFALSRLGLDPASASAPFVATVVDVTGLVIYFSVATVLLTGVALARIGRRGWERVGMPHAETDVSRPRWCPDRPGVARPGGGGCRTPSRSSIRPDRGGRGPRRRPARRS
jgi:magnesium transporter